MKAVITAGGEGRRLYPSSRAFPKELIHFCGFPIIEHGIRMLKENNINDIFIVTGRKKGALQDYFGSGWLFDVNIAYITQEEPKGLGDAVLCTRPYIEDSRDENFVLMLGDTILNNACDLKEMLELHSLQGALSTTLVEKICLHPERYGVVKLKNFDGNYSEVEDFYEKPQSQDIRDKFSFNGCWFVIAGLYVLNKRIFHYIENTPMGANSELQLTDALKKSLSDSKSLAYLMKGTRVDVGTWEYLKDEREHYRNMSDDELYKIISSRKSLIKKIASSRKSQS